MDDTIPMAAMTFAWCPVLAVVVAATALPAQSDPIDLTFGVYTTDKPSAMYRQFTPLLEALEPELERVAKTSVSVEIRILKSYAAGRNALAQGQVDFVRFGPASYVLAKRVNPGVQLLAMEEVDGKKTFKGFIAVRASSGIKELGDLRGKRFAFGDPTSTIGRFLAQRALLGAGIKGEDLAKYSFLGRHDMVFRAVQAGDFDAGALKSTTFESLNDKSKAPDRLKVLASFDNVTKPWVARADLPPKLTEILRTALLNLRDKAVMRSLGIDRLVAGEDGEYDGIRKSMDDADRFAPPAKPR